MVGETKNVNAQAMNETAVAQKPQAGNKVAIATQKSTEKRKGSKNLYRTEMSNTYLVYLLITNGRAAPTGCHCYAG